MSLRRLPEALLVALLIAAAPADAGTAGLLTARPAAPATEAGERGQVRLPDGVGTTLAYIPVSYRPGAPLLVVLHGAGGTAAQALDRFADDAETHGLIVVAPQSTAQTWDIVANAHRMRNGAVELGEFGTDARRLDAALSTLFAGYAVDPTRMALAGFSDGATYALMLGSANGDLFTHLIAFSPGFGPTKRGPGRPRVFIAHGKRDPVLTYAVTDRFIVPALRAQKLDVTFHRFDGGHTVPPGIETPVFGWFLGQRSGAGTPD